MMRLFKSPIKNLVIVMKPTYAKEVDGVVVTVPGKKIRFVDGKYIPKNDEEYKFLKEYAKKNKGMVVEIEEEEIKKISKKENIKRGTVSSDEEWL